MQKPIARRDNLLSEMVGQELVLVDRKTNRAHRMNRTAAIVWQHCDGKHSVGELAGELGRALPVGDSARSLTEATLHQLKDLNLLENQVVIGRRDVARRLAIAAGLIPVIASIVVPTPARAASGSGPIA